MATNSIGEGKEVISASVPHALAREIERRAAVLGWSKSKYAAHMFARWYEQGCPPLSAGEAILREHRAGDYPMQTAPDGALAEPQPAPFLKQSTVPAKTAPPAPTKLSRRQAG